MSYLEGLTRINEHWFESDDSLEEIEIPDTIVSIGEDAFFDSALYNNPSNWDDDGVLYIDKWLIKANGNIIDCDEYVIKEGTVGIADHAFDGCTNLTNIKIPNSLKYIGDRSFDTGRCNLLISDGDGVTYIDKWLIQADKNIIEGKYVIKEGTVGVADHAFSNCGNLTAVELPDSVKYIGSSAFCFCYGLETVTISNSVKKIGEYVFAMCDLLNEIVFEGTIKEWEDIEKDENWMIGCVTISCVDGEIEFSSF